MDWRGIERRIRRERPRCPFCHEGIEPEVLKHGCPRCMAWHHEACWSEGGHRCSTCGFADAPSTRPAAVSADAEAKVESEEERGWRQVDEVMAREGRRRSLDQQVRDLGEMILELPRELFRGEILGVIAILLVLCFAIPSIVIELIFRILSGFIRALTHEPGPRAIAQDDVKQLEMRQEPPRGPEDDEEGRRPEPPVAA